MMVSSAQHLSPDIFNNSLEFNPRRWKVDSSCHSKSTCCYVDAQVKLHIFVEADYVVVTISVFKI